jgi:pilus assembly protein CpaB
VRGRLIRSPRAYAGVSAACGVLAMLAVRAYATTMAGTAAPEGRAVAVVVAARPVARGVVVSRADLRVEVVPSRYAEPGSLSTLSKAAGRVALADLAPGETVTQTRLARVRAGPVASLLPEGLRAFAVPTSLPMGTVRPGDHVDVLATYGGSQPHTESVVEAVEVLLVLGPGGIGGAPKAGGISLDASAAGGPSTQTLVVLVAPEQEHELAYARAFADLEVAIAPPR